jgi:hypothetical protein
MQPESNVLPARDCVFTGHPRQAADPVPVLKVPAPHAVQDVPSAPVYPSRQMQSDSNVLPVGDCVFDGHVTHALDPV